MASRYGSHLTNRGLFANFDDQQQRGNSHSPVRPNSGYGNRYSSTPDNTSSYNSYAPPSSGPSFSAYPGDAGTPSNTFRAPTPNRNASGAMSMAELEHLESQGDEQIGSIIGKIGRLKDLSLRIGDEIRDSSKLADTMNDTFSGTSLRLKGTMTRMLQMADSTGVGWRVWLGFFAAVILLFWYVWLF